MKSYGSSFPPGLRVEGEVPRKGKPRLRSNIDRGQAGLESGEATAKVAVASISSYLVTLSTLLVPMM